MKPILTLVSLMILTACGTESGGGSANLVDPDTQKQGDAPAGTDLSAQLVATQAAAPVCDEAAEGRLIYVQDEKAFKSCAAGEYAVIVLDIPKGEKGDKGDIGEVGAKGADGADGVNGTDGLGTLWVDPITEYRWIAATAGNFATALVACGGDYELPTEGQLLDAALHGIANSLDQHTSAWAGPDSGNSWNYSVTVGANPTAGTTTKTDTIGVYCVRLP